jgi:hypothetical protein
MAAAGLYGTQSDNEHVINMANFALDIMQQLRDINEQSFNHFRLRIGLGKLKI